MHTLNTSSANTAKGLRLICSLLLALFAPVCWAQSADVAKGGDDEAKTGSEAAAPAESQEDSAAELAKKLSNPIASLISVPIQYTWTTGIGPAEADQNRIIVQPVTPFSISSDWNLIVRTIVPLYINQQSPTVGGSSTSGTGDILQSFFFSPKAPTESGWVWGAGAALSYDTATKDALGSGKWSAGPTVVLLKQSHGTTYGLLANQIWSFAGSDDREGVSSMFLQPFLSHTTKKYTTYGINLQSTYDWKSEEWTVPVFLSVSQLVKIAKKPVSFQLAYFNYVDKPQYGPDWGLQFTVSLLYPK